MVQSVLRKLPKKSTHQIGDDPDTTPCTAQAVKMRLVEVFRSPAYRPPMLPAVVLELQGLSRKTKIEVREIVAVISKEPLLAARLLQLAGSALYGSRPVESLETAVVRLGMQRTCDLFLQAALEARIFRAPGYEREMATLARHSALVAEVAVRVGAFAHLPAEHTFMCGLLHDVGMAASLIALADVARGASPPPVELALPAVQEVHTQAGAHLTQMWRLPPEVRLVIENHHLRGGRDVGAPPVAAVAIADFLVTQEGVSIEAAAVPPCPEMLKAAHLEAADLVRLRGTTKTLVAAG
jgi:HD-like signal output (HDOD) protein